MIGQPQRVPWCHDALWATDPTGEEPIAEVPITGYLITEQPIA